MKDGHDFSILALAAIVFQALAAFLCSQADMLAICKTRNDTDHSCKLSSQSRKQFDM
jgi:hypothetical protein